MAKLSAREAAILRMAMHDEQRDLRQGMTNTSPDIGAMYPRLMYRATAIEDKRVVSEDKDGRPREWTIANSFGGLLCDTQVCSDADEAEAMAEAGWDTSPAAAHGLKSGLVAATTAKDDEIAALREQIAAMQAVEPVKRGPGRPPKAENIDV